MNHHQRHHRAINEPLSSSQRIALHRFQASRDANEFAAAAAGLGAGDRSIPRARVHTLRFPPATILISAIRQLCARRLRVSTCPKKPPIRPLRHAARPTPALAPTPTLFPHVLCRILPSDPSLPPGSKRNGGWNVRVVQPVRGDARRHNPAPPPLVRAGPAYLPAFNNIPPQTPTSDPTLAHNSADVHIAWRRRRQYRVTMYMQQRSSTAHNVCMYCTM